MGIFKRFWTMLKSNLNALIGKAEDPEKMLNQMLLDMQEQLINSKRQVAVSIADEKRLRQQFEKEKNLTTEWEQKAMIAIKAGKDDLARQALERKTDHQKQAQAFEQQWQAQDQSVQQLKGALQKLSNKISDAKRKKNLLVSRAKRAEAQQSITETMSGLNQNSAFDTIERMEQKIDQMEAEAQATTELANEISHDHLSSEIDQLGCLEADSALSDLKEKMGLSSKSAADVSSTSQASSSELQRIEAQIQEEVSRSK